MPIDKLDLEKRDGENRPGRRMAPLVLTGIVIIVTIVIAFVVLRRNDRSWTDTKLDELRLLAINPDFDNFRFGLMTKDGEAVTERVFRNIPRFSEGLAPVRTYGTGGWFYGYIDTSGRWKIPPRFAVEEDHIFSIEEAFQNGRAGFCVDVCQCGYIDTDGNVAIEPRYTFAAPFSEELAYVVRFSENEPDIKAFIRVDGSVAFHLPPMAECDIGERFSEGLVAFQQNQKSGYLDRTGRIAIRPKFDRAMPFSEGIAAVKTGENWGYIDKVGEFMIPAVFDRAASFSEGLAAVRIDGRYGYINRSGETIIAPEYASAESFSEGLAIVQPNPDFDACGFIDAQGNEVVSAICEIAWAVTDGWGACWPFGYFDPSGRLVWRAEGYQDLHPDALKPEYWEALQDKKGQAGP